MWYSWYRSELLFGLGPVVFVFVPRIQGASAGTFTKYTIYTTCAVFLASAFPARCPLLTRLLSTAHCAFQSDGVGVGLREAWVSILPDGLYHKVTILSFPVSFVLSVSTLDLHFLIGVCSSFMPLFPYDLGSSASAALLQRHAWERWGVGGVVRSGTPGCPWDAGVSVWRPCFLLALS